MSDAETWKPGQDTQAVATARLQGQDPDKIHCPVWGVIGNLGDSICYAGVPAKVEAIQAELRRRVTAADLPVRVIAPNYAGGVSDGQRNGTPQMRYSLIGRETTNDGVCLHLEGSDVRGVIAVVACDKPPVGTLAAILEHNVPAVIMSDGSIRPLAHRIFAFGELDDAIRLMQSSGHIGKLVLEPRANAGVRLREPPAITLRRDGTYLVTGGLKDMVGLKTEVVAQALGAKLEQDFKTAMEEAQTAYGQEDYTKAIAATDRASILKPNDAAAKKIAAMEKPPEFEPGDVERLGRYLALLLDANTRFNLTAITDPNEAWHRHILDSLTLVAYIVSDQVARLSEPGMRAVR